MKPRINHEKLHVVFEISLVLKGAFEVLEIGAGVLVCFVNQAFVLRIVHLVTDAELSEDPDDVVARYLLQAARHFSTSRQHFVALFLLSHGLLKLWLIMGLWRERIRYYPVAMAVFGAFILYQFYRFSFTRSPLLLAMSVVDLAVIWLIWMEYRYLRVRK